MTRTWWSAAGWRRSSGSASAGLAVLVGAHLTLPSRGGTNADLKVPALVAGMVIGADSIADMNVLRHGG